MFHHGFQTPRNNKSSLPAASCFICFSTFGTPDETIALVSDIQFASVQFIYLLAAFKARNNRISNQNLSKTAQNHARSLENNYLAHPVIVDCVADGNLPS